MHTCRICLEPNASKQISNGNCVIDGECKTYSSMILFCLDVEINSELDNTFLCGKCDRMLLTFYKFKNMAWRNDVNYKTIKNFIKKEHDYNDMNDTSDEFVLEAHIKTVCTTKIELSSDEENLLKLNDNEDDCDVTDPISNILSNSNDTIEEDCKDILSNDDIKSEHLSQDSLEDEITSTYKQDAIEALTDIKNNRDMNSNWEDIPLHLRKRRVKADTAFKNFNQNNVKPKKRFKNLQVKKKKFKCEDCEKTFSTNKDRLKHYRRKHLNLKTKCSFCDKEYSDVTSHIKLIHETNNFTITCDICGKKFLRKKMLEIHMLALLDVRPFPCSVCSRKFRTNSLLLSHKRRVHDKELSCLCQYCSKSFFSKGALIRHIRIHTKERPYKCDQCNKTFNATGILKIHRLRHTGIKSCICKICNKGFYSLSNLTKHMVTHSKHRQYECHYCDMVFVRSDHRNVHEKNIHLKHFVPEPKQSIR